MLKRLTIGLVSHVDEIVARVENHEALATEALRELRQGVARARVRLGRVRADGEGLRRELAASRDAAAAWRERARGADDEETGLECLRRARRAAREVEMLAARVAEHERDERALDADVEGLERRACALADARNVMRTRQSRAEAMGVVHGTEVRLGSEIEAVFDRWEARVKEAELASGGAVERPDAFEERILDEEERASLRAELARLRREGEDDA